MGFLKILRYFVKALAYTCYLLIGIYLFVSLPIFFGYKPLIVLSGSMVPTYDIGDVIYSKNVEYEEIRVDDVITYQSENDTFITHRVVDIIDGKFQTKGDANEMVDLELVIYPRVSGKVANYYLPLVGYYIKFINENLYLVLVAVLILVSEFIMSNMKTFDINSKRKELEV